MKDIKNYEGLYKITKDGRVFSVRSNKFLKLNYKKNGYVHIELNKYGEAKTYRVHRLVAEAYVPNPDNKPIVHHKNNIKHDNRAENLEWCTILENTQRAYDDGVFTPPRAKKHYVVNHSGEVIYEADSLEELSKITGYSISSISTYKQTQKPLRNGKYKGYKIRR